MREEITISTGFYKNWNKKAPLIPQVKWYTAKSVITYLHESRTQIINKKYYAKYLVLQSIDAPLERNTRFSESEAYVCEGIGDWNFFLDKLLLAQSILNKERKINEESIFRSIGEAEMYALDQINQLLQKLSCIEILVTQERFESMYGLEWIEGRSWFVMFAFAWFDDIRIMPVMVTGILQRVDRMWHIVAPHS